MRGTTLLELVVALAILGTALGVVGLGVRAVTPPAEAEVLGALRAVRERAIQTGAPVTFTGSGSAVRFAPDGSATGGPVLADSATYVVDPLTGMARRVPR